MSEYIGCQISLISKSEIRYVGILHQIDSDSATVALKEVKSYGTEGRKAGAIPPEDEIPASDHVYEYIVFRGNDVAHLNIIQRPDEIQPPRPQMPDDPAIIGTDRPPFHHHQAPPQQWQQQQQQPFPPQQNVQAQYPPYGYPPQQTSGFAGPGGPHGFPGAPGAVPAYGMPPYHGAPGGGWYQGPPTQNFPPGPLPPGQLQDRRPFTPGDPGLQASVPSPLGSMRPSQHGDDAGKPAADVQGSQQHQPPHQLSAKPADSVQEPRATELSATPTRTSTTSTAAKGQNDNGRMQNRASGAQNTRDSRVALPKAPIPNTFASIAAKSDRSNGTDAGPQPKGPAPASVTAPAAGPERAKVARDNQDVTSRAAAAVAAAMAKLGATPAQPSAPPSNSSQAHMHDLTRKMNDTRLGSNQRGRGGHHRGGNRHVGGGPRQTGATIDIPAGDFDFETANAKFNKSEVVREAAAAAAAAGSPVGKAGAETNSEAESGPTVASIAPIPIPAAGSSMYDKKSSFFDNISSDLKDRSEEQAAGGSGAGQAGGAGGGVGGGRGSMNTRYAQRKQNMETFGQANVDGGAGYHRGGHGGRGRGRGRGRGGFQRQENRGEQMPGQQGQQGRMRAV